MSEQRVRRSAIHGDPVAPDAAPGGMAPRGGAPTPPDRRLALTTSEVARRLGVSLGTVRRWADAGHLPSYRTPGGQRRFSAEDVDDFVTSLGRAGGPGRTRP